MRLWILSESCTLNSALNLSHFRPYKHNFQFEITWFYSVADVTYSFIQLLYYIFFHPGSGGIVISEKFSAQPIRMFWELMFFFSVLSEDFWNLENQNLHRFLVPVVYDNTYILSDQISGIFKGIGKNGNFE